MFTISAITVVNIAFWLGAWFGWSFPIRTGKQRALRAIAWSIAIYGVGIILLLLGGE